MISFQHIVDRICSDSDSGQIIIKLYLGAVILFALLIGSLKLFCRIFPGSRINSEEDKEPMIYQWLQQSKSNDFDLEQDEEEQKLTEKGVKALVVYVYLDLNSYLYSAISTNSITNQIQDAVGVCLEDLKTFEQDMIMFNYRCYVESGLDDVTQNSWIHKLTFKIKSLRNHSICIYLKSPKSLDCHLNRPKRLLTDLLTSSGRTGLNGQRRLYVISTDDSGIVNYGLRILKSYPQSPLTCFIDPVGAFNDPVASDFIFRWNNDQTLDLMGHKKPSLQLEPTFNQFESHDQSYFDPLIWIFKAYGPPKVPVLTLETLVEILKAWDLPIPSNELNSREDSILKYIRSALSSRLIRFCSKLEDENSLLDSINRRSNYLILEESICSSDLLCEQTDFLNDRPSRLPKTDHNTKSFTEDDGLTTTGSDSENEMVSKVYDPSTGISKAEDKKSFSVRNKFGKLTQQQPPKEAKTTNVASEPRKNKIGSSEMVFTTDGPNKKKKKQCFMENADQPIRRVSPSFGNRNMSKRRANHIRNSSEPKNFERDFKFGFSPSLQDDSKLPISKNPIETDILQLKGPSKPRLNINRLVGVDCEPRERLLRYSRSMPSPGLWMNVSSGMMLSPMTSNHLSTIDHFGNNHRPDKGKIMLYNNMTNFKRGSLCYGGDSLRFRRMIIPGLLKEFKGRDKESFVDCKRSTGQLREERCSFGEICEDDIDDEVD